jgi:endoglucanase
MTRRNFVKISAAAAAGALLPSRGRAQSAPAPRPQPRIPPWRGFNLSGVARGTRALAYKETDFEWMAGWGFNFARLPLS